MWHETSPRVNSLIALQKPSEKVGFVRFVILFIIIAVLTGAINSLVSHEGRLLYEFLFLAGLLSYLRYFVSNDTTGIVLVVVMWTMAIFSSYVAWKLNGINATIIIAYPSILIFTVILCGWMNAVLICFYLLISLVFLVYAQQSGLIESPLNSIESQWGKLLSIIIILSIYALGMWLVTRLFSQVLEKLKYASKKTKSLEHHAQVLLEHDALTKLPNLIKTKQDFQTIYGKKSDNEKLAMFVIDVSNFKVINSTLGYQVGDDVLVSVSQKLIKFTDYNCHIYRSSGSEFILLKVAEEYSLFEELTAQLLQLGQAPISVGEIEIILEIKIGAAIAPLHAQEFETLFRQAKTALIKARDENEGSKFYESQMEQQINNKLSLIKEMKQGIKNEEFILHYQPIVDLTTNRVIAAEALVRWQKGDNLIYPDSFIAEAEESRLINELGRFVIFRACLDAKQWQKNQRLSGVSVCVNLSPIQFRNGNLKSIVEKAIVKSGLNAKHLNLEITESLFFEDIRLAQVQLDGIAAMGCQIAIDDFGAGYSNLNYLNLFKANKLKIDRSFITDIVSQRNDQHIVQAIVNMSQSLGLENIAEGIEDESSCRFLNQMGCRYGQGYYWSKPLPLTDYIEYAVSANASSSKQ